MHTFCSSRIALGRLAKFWFKGVCLYYVLLFDPFSGITCLGFKALMIPGEFIHLPPSHGWIADVLPVIPSLVDAVFRRAEVQYHPCVQPWRLAYCCR
jgi:hypothetical protein